MRIFEFPMKIMVIDDMQTETMRIENLLGKVKYNVEVTCFNDPEEALEELKKNEYDLVITDIVMDKVPGDDIVKFCANLGNGTQVTVITGAEDLSTAIRCYNWGAQEILKKPVSQQDLTEMIERTASHFERVNSTFDRIAKDRSKAS